MQTTTNTHSTTAVVNEHKVIAGNCLHQLQKLPSEQFDLVFADPPYNLQLAQQLSRPDGSIVNGVDDDWDKFNNFAAYDNFTTQWLTEAKRMLKPSGSLWVIGSYHNIFRIGNCLQNLGFWLLNDIVWIKHNPMPNFRGRRFTNAHETILWCAKSKDARYKFNYQAMKARNDDKQMRSDWYLPICGGKERIKDQRGRKAHPTQKPEALLQRIILACTHPGDLILDPFLGSGTTIAVAKSLGRKAIGIEQDPKYCKIARARLNKVKPLATDLVAIPEPKQQARIPFGHLLESGMITPGTTLNSQDRQHQAQVTASGMLQSGNEIGSIHGLGAKLSGSVSCNGWNFWHLPKQSNDGKSIPINELRDLLREQQSLTKAPFAGNIDAASSKDSVATAR